MKSNANPAVAKAYECLKKGLVGNLWPTGTFLPSATRLAAEIGVSRVPLFHAIARLREEHLLSGLPHSRIRVGPPSLSLPGINSDTEAWRTKRTQLESDILSGRYAAQGRLPEFKILQESYGCCYRTMKRVVTSLVDDGVVLAQKKRYCLIQLPAAANNRTIVFIVNRSSVKSRSALNQGQYRVMELFEQECAHRGLVPLIVEVDFYNPSDTRDVLRSAAFPVRAEGYVIDLWWYESHAFIESYQEILARLAGLKRPVSILDENAEARLPVPFSHNSFFQLFCIEGKGAGSTVARALLSLGHAAISFISPFHNQSYSRRRLEGIVEQYGRTGAAGSVAPVVIDTIEQPYGFVLALSELDNTTLRKVIGVGRTESQAADMYRLYVVFKKRLESLHLANNDRTAIKKSLAPLAALAARSVETGYFERAAQVMLDEAENHMIDALMRPLFQQALSVRESTAWVCVTDFVAVSALAFLRERGISVPDQIAVVGFDNDPVRAFENRLTTYDFNANGFVHAMLNFIARPPKPRVDYSHKTIEIAGNVISRSTTAPRKTPHIR